MRLCACSEYLAAVHCKDLSNVLQEKTLPFGWACVHVLVWQGSKGGHVSWAGFHSRSQGLEGVFGLSGVEDFREKEKETEEEKTEMGRDGSHSR